MNTSNKRARLGFDKPIVDVWQREVGQISSRRFALQFAASKDLILKLGFFRKLEKHKGCVNTVSFNAAGDILVSGSDDRKVILWDWEAGHTKLSFHSGHHGNVFQAKFMPYSEDRSIITCGADGQVRHAEILSGGDVETINLGQHRRRAHNLAIEPGSPHIFYTCGEDGLLLHFDLRTKSNTELFTCRSIGNRGSLHPYIRLNAIAIDPRNPNLFAVGGDDEYARLYDIRKYKWDGSNDFDQPVDFFCPQHVIGDEQVGITGVAFSELSELLVSYNDENIYLFAKDMGLGANPIPRSTTHLEMDCDEKYGPQVYKGHTNCDTVKGVGFFGPRCDYIVSGSDCGRIFIWKKKGGELIRVIQADVDVVNCIVPHPHTTMLASSGIENDIKIWTPMAEQRATLPPHVGELKARRRGWIYPVAPSEMLMQLVSRRDQGSRVEGSLDESLDSGDLLELILSFTRRTNYDDGGDDSGPEDYFS